MRALFALALAACATTLPSQKFAVTPTPASTDRLRAAQLAPALAELETFLRDEASRRKLPSLAVGVVTDEGLVWFRGFGARDLAAGDPVTADSVFRIGSITKVFTGLALLQLRDAGKLVFDASATRFLPELSGVIYPSRDSTPITIRQLVTHTSGLPRLGAVDYTRPDRDPTASELLAGLRDLELESTPGTRQEYSNLAMALAGFVVARASGQSWREYVRAHILLPLGMNATAFDRGEVPAASLATGYVRDGDAWKPVAHHWRLGAVESAGILYSSVADMARFVRFQLAAWPPRDAPDDAPVRRASLRESQQVMAGTFGVNWVIDKDSVWHNGGTEAYRSMVMMQPRRGIAVIVFIGCEDDAADELGRAALSRLAPAGAPQLSAALKAALDRFLTFHEHPDEAGIERTFSSAFRKGVPNLLAIAQRMREESGPCKLDRVISAEPLSAVVRLVCEKQSSNLQFRVGVRPPHLIDGALLKPANDH